MVEALERVVAGVRPLPAERVPLLDALGRTLAETIVSPVDHPPWNNSAMDGFAVRSSDVRGARREAPVRLTVVEEVQAGHFPAAPLQPGQAVKIMTGAPVPEGADGVIRIEHTDAWQTPGTREAGPAPGDESTDEVIQILDDSDAGHNIRPRGEDLSAGETVLEAGHVLRPAEIGILAAVGRSQVAVHRRPRVAILSNGDELAELERFDQVLAGRKIVNSNSYALAAAAVATGCTPVLLGVAHDDAESIREHAERGLGMDALVTTAGASVGEHDQMKAVLERMGLELDFWRVRIRPGSPFSFGRLEGMPVFGLPGNPVSALVTFEVFVRPVLRRLAGRRLVHTPLITVRAAERLPSKPGLVQFLRVRTEAGPHGERLARSTGPQGSGILRSLLEADALLIVPEGSGGVEAGEVAHAIPLGGLDPAVDEIIHYRTVSSD